MPSWSFKNKETGEVFDKTFRSFRKKEEFLEENPNYEVVFTKAPKLGDSTKMTSTKVKKLDGGFKETLQRIDQRSPGSQISKNSDYI